MEAFSVILEGRDGSDAYFVTVSVAHHTVEAAEALAVDYAQHEGWNIVGIEETGHEMTADLPPEPGVIETTGRAYISAEEA